MNKKKQLIGILVLIIFLLINLTITFALYKSNKSGNVQISVASPKIRIINSTTHIDTLDLNKYSNNFKIVNYDEENNISEVGMDYTLSFSYTDKNAPIDIKLYEIEDNGSEKEIQLDNNRTTIESTNFNGNIKQEKNYRIEIVFNLETGHMQENVDVNINLNSIQVKPV